MYKGTLTKDSPISKEFSFEGTVNILLVGGIGELVIERSVMDSDFYPLSTDISGGEAILALEGECAYNGTLEEKGLQTKYRFRAELSSGETSYIVTRPK